MSIYIYEIYFPFTWRDVIEMNISQEVSGNSETNNNLFY